MERFTIEEKNLVKVCVQRERREMVQELMWLLRHCEGYMKELVGNTINKLENTTDQEFAALLDYPAEIFDEEDEENGK